MLYPPYLCFLALLSTADNNCVGVWLLSVHVAWGHIFLYFILLVFFSISHFGYIQYLTYCLLLPLTTASLFPPYLLISLVFFPFSSLEHGSSFLAFFSYSGWLLSMGCDFLLTGAGEGGRGQTGHGGNCANLICNKSSAGRPGRADGSDFSVLFLLIS